MCARNSGGGGGSAGLGLSPYGVASLRAQQLLAAFEQHGATAASRELVSAVREAEGPSPK